MAGLPSCLRPKPTSHHTSAFSCLRRSHSLQPAPFRTVNQIRLPLLFALLVPFVARGQAEWRSALYPADWSPPEDRRFETDKLIQDFSYAGYRRGEVKLPVFGGPRFDATAFGADPTGTADSTAAIQAAIDAAAFAGGGVAYLPAGTFKVSP